MITVFAMLLGVVSAVLESDRIEEHRPIRHNLLTAARVLLVGVFAFSAWSLLSLSWLDLGLQLAGAPAAFALVHRPFLNMLRRPMMEPWYVSPSNRYDWLLITWATYRTTGQFVLFERTAWLATHRSRFFVLQDAQYRRTIELAGSTAYRVELAVLAGTALLRVLL